MNFLEDFIFPNFILLCVSIMMLIILIQRYKQHPRISLYTILIISCALILAATTTLEAYFKKVYISATLTLVFAVLGYVIRPVCIYLFILLTGKIAKKSHFLLAAIPLFINLCIFSLSFAPNVSEYVVYFEEIEGVVLFHGGPLRFASHIISLGYLIWLLYLSFSFLGVRRMYRGLSILGCALFVILAVVFESFFNGSGGVYLLNTTIAVSALFYYLFIYIEKAQVDTLTGLLNRETFYQDIKRMGRNVTGVVQFDMNGLKYINDNFGHAEGDKALATIAKLIQKSSSRKMYSYRMGGDEYLLLATDSTEHEVEEMMNKFRTSLSETEYHCSIGYSYRKGSSQPLEEMMKEAETRMYEDKAKFYQTSSIKRRKQ